MEQLWPLFMSDNIQNVHQGLALFTAVATDLEAWKEKYGLWHIDEQGVIVYPASMMALSHKEFIALSLMVAYWYPKKKFPSYVQLLERFPFDNITMFSTEFESILSEFSVTDRGEIHWTFQVVGARVDTLIRRFRHQQLDMLLTRHRERAEKVTTIRVSRSALTVLPDWILKCENLQSLQLSHNRLTALPRELYTLTQLRELNLASNRKLTQISTGIAQLQHLEIVLLSSTGITKLPDDFGGLSRLKKLDIGRTNITAFPQTCQTLTALQSLSIGLCTQLDTATLPKHLPNLRWFSAVHMGWSGVPSVLEGWPSLEALILSRNEIASCRAILKIKPKRIVLDGNPLAQDFIEELHAVDMQVEL